MKITNKSMLLQYIKTKLGDGYTQIVDIKPESYIDAIDDAVTTFVTRVYEGSEEAFISIPVEYGKVTYKLPSNVITAIKILDDGLFSGVFSPMDGYTNTVFEEYGYSEFNLMDYVLFNNTMNTYNKYLNDEYTYSYNSIYNNLKIFKMPKQTKSVVLHCYVTPEPEDIDYACIYNHEWVKKRVEALVLERWYLAYLKTDGDLFDGNVSIDKKAIQEEYEKKLEATEIELDEIYTGIFGAIYR